MHYVFYGAGALVNLLADGLTSKILAVAVLVIGGLIIYGVLSLVTGAANRDDIRRVLRR